MLLTHHGLIPEIGTESVVKEKDKPKLRQIVQTLGDLSYLDPELLIKTGLAHRELGDSVEAVRYYRASLQIEESERAFFHLGYDLHELGRYKEAIERWEKANEIRPEDANTLMNWGNALRNLGRYEEAIQKYQQADKIRPEDANTLVNWGIALQMLKRFKEAKKMYQRAATIARATGDTVRAEKYEKLTREL